MEGIRDSKKRQRQQHVRAFLMANAQRHPTFLSAAETIRGLIFGVLFLPADRVNFIWNLRQLNMNIDKKSHEAGGGFKPRPSWPSFENGSRIGIGCLRGN
jgi:hypothetical protein